MKPLVPGVLALVACSSARAGIFVEASRTDLANLLRPPEVQRLWFDGGSLRIESERTDAVEIFKDETLYLLAPAQKRYTAVELARSATAATSLVPAAVQTPGDASVRATSRVESVAGQSCRIWELWRDGSKEQELCIVPESALPEGTTLSTSMRAVGAAMAVAGTQAEGAPRDSVAEAWVDLSRVDGIALLVRRFQSGRPVLEVRITGLRAEPIPFTAFEIPTEYRLHRTGSHAALAASAGEHTARAHRSGS